MNFKIIGTPLQLKRFCEVCEGKSLRIYAAKFFELRCIRSFFEARPNGKSVIAATVVYDIDGAAEEGIEIINLRDLANGWTKAENRIRMLNAIESLLRLGFEPHSRVTFRRGDIEVKNIDNERLRISFFNTNLGEEMFMLVNPEDVSFFTHTEA